MPRIKEREFVTRANSRREGHQCRWTVSEDAAGNCLNKMKPRAYLSELKFLKES